eukprot:Blabericola_migrator_1__48@NODE_1010_length_5714_cov_79_058438_g693_i0_p1_GENE_NODE_1010_length_5714_cov_79_058438_g693_i0NODE_1010_length_5714_cov_79_058438_g693_i0_p1_ORF_typecomplete_len438_score39_23RPC_C/PF11800_8/0_098RPC_C/PF11800_8/3_1e03RPC_C/PF11800_8/8_5e03_NODE_1010_length_5714_cov_79_058438_g693_i0281314
MSSAHTPRDLHNFLISQEFLTSLWPFVDPELACRLKLTCRSIHDWVMRPERQLHSITECLRRCRLARQWTQFNQPRSWLELHAVVERLRHLEKVHKDTKYPTRFRYGGSVWSRASVPELDQILFDLRGIANEYGFLLGNYGHLASAAYLRNVKLDSKEDTYAPTHSLKADVSCEEHAIDTAHTRQENSTFTAPTSPGAGPKVDTAQNGIAPTHSPASTQILLTLEDCLALSGWREIVQCTSTSRDLCIADPGWSPIVYFRDGYAFLCMRGALQDESFLQSLVEDQILPSDLFEAAWSYLPFQHHMPSRIMDAFDRSIPLWDALMQLPYEEFWDVSKHPNVPASHKDLNNKDDQYRLLEQVGIWLERCRKRLLEKAAVAARQFAQPTHGQYAVHSWHAAASHLPSMFWPCNADFRTGEVGGFLSANVFT